AGGVANATTNDPSASGQLTVHDVDSGEDHFATPTAASLVGTYGNFTFDPATGAWTYTLDQSKADHLTDGQHVTDTLTVASFDGTASQPIVVNITGSNDFASITGTATGSVTEDGTLTAGNTLTVNDVDSGENHFQTPGSLAGTYGTFTFNATSGVWGYTLANNQANVQALAGGTQVHDTLTVKSVDGTATQTINVTITGTNDAPVVTAGNTLSFTAGSAAAAISPAATVTDIDSVDFNGGHLTVALTANGAATDQLTIQNQGTGAGQIGLAGNNVTYGGVVIGTFSGGNNGTNLSVTFTSAAATPAAVQALLDHILYATTSSVAATKTVTYTVVDGDGVVNGGADTGTATATINVTAADTTPPSVSISHQLSSSHQQSTFTVHATDASGISIVKLFDSVNGGPPTLIYTFTAAELQAATNGNYVHTFTDGTAPFGTINNDIHQISAQVIDNSSNSATAVDPVTFNTNGGNQSNTKFSAPAGISGEPMNLGLTDPTGHYGEVTLTVAGAPADWVLNGATHNADGSWTIATNDVGSLTITTPSTYAGALALNVTETWTNPDGSIESATVVDNVEAYAKGTPIFAWSGDDNLTGASGRDTFVFSQPIGNDVVHSFEVSSDVIDLISYGWQSFADVQAHTADDASGNAVITLADGQTITLDGVHAADLTASNFEFDVTPTVENPGQMTIGDGAMLPLSGVIHNTGEIDLQASGDDTLLQLIQTGVTLNGGGHVVLSDDDHNIIAGTASNVSLDNVDNVISGAGQIGQGDLTLSNEGTIDASGTHALVIDTGANVIINAGTLEATGTGGLVLESAVANSGLIWANGGTVTAEGVVTGSGNALISGTGTIEFGAASAAGVTFDTTAAGHLILDDAFHFSGTVSGLDGNDDIDIRGISFGAGTTLSFTENLAGTGGTLTVSDGAHTANIVLLGQYDPNGFAEKADTANGTVITYDPHHIA
ncbi:VCBS repeat-containing protein, partial [Bradyrhizobium brasilense]